MPAIQSSAMIPHPPGRFSSRRIGHGFQMSNTRKRIKPSKRYFQFTRLSAKKIAKVEKSMRAPKYGSAIAMSGSKRANTQSAAARRGAPGHKTQVEPGWRGECRCPGQESAYRQTPRRNRGAA